MGRPKLLLPWCGTTIVGHLIEQLQRAGIGQVLVVARAGDAALADEVIRAGATAISPLVDPTDMRRSVEWGVKSAFGAIGNTTVPAGWLLIPADHPFVASSTIDALRAAWVDGERQILVPTYGGRRGHPTLFSSHFANEVAGIPADQGVNWLVRQNTACLREVPVDDESVILDLDTPEDYQRLLIRYPEARS